MKKILCLSLCLALLAVGIVACGKEESSVANDEITTEETEVASITNDEEDEISEDVTENESANSEAKATEDDLTQDAGSKVLVAYFSRTGNTKPLAEYAASYYGADLYEIVAAEPYTDEDIDYGDSNSRTTIEQNDVTVRPEINGNVSDMDQYDTIILAYPIWWGQAPRIISTFLESYDFSGKTIVPFCTSASSDIGSSDDDLHSLVSETATWIDGKRFAAGTSEADFTAWLEEVYPKN